MTGLCINERTTMPFDHEDEFEMEQSFADQNGEVAPIDAEQPAIELPLKYPVSYTHLTLPTIYSV